MRGHAISLRESAWKQPCPRRRGSEVVPARDLDKARRAIGDHPRVTINTHDLIDPDSIDAFAERFKQHYPALHILINNAGYIGRRLERDRRGYKVSLQLTISAIFS